MYFFKLVVGLLLSSRSLARNVLHPIDNGRTLPEEYHATEPQVVFPQAYNRLPKHPSASEIRKTVPQNITHQVQNTFLEMVPTNPKLQQVRDNVTAYVVEKWGARSNGFNVNIASPKMDTCKSVVSNVQRLATGIFCQQESGCSQQHTISLTSTYSTTNGFKAGASFTAGGGIEFIASVEMSVSFETSFEAQWARAQSTTDQYTFTLKKGEFCTPSMVHVDLECDATVGNFRWDTWWNGNSLIIENWNQRKTPPGPYEHGQWCKDLWFDIEAVRSPQMETRWKPLLEFDPYRGWLYMYPTTDLNAYLTSKDRTSHPLTENEIVIRRHEHDASDKSWGWRCSRPTQYDKDSKIRVPLKGSNGELLGLIGCV